MAISVLLFFSCFAGWLGSLRLFLEKQSLPRIFGVLIMSIWTYITLVLFIIDAFAPPFMVLLILGLIPVFAVAYGYRLYDHYKGRNPRKSKRKNDELHDELHTDDDS